ncbi:MAG TPA: ABC transporter [Ruminococcaceae bacterium]|jgi:ABC-2 type transport system ATP-binding protein|nr:ABC transporter [Oscillospiraceae bacterium]
MKNILEVDRLCKKYRGFELKDVSFRIPGGSIMGFIGENGAGKTTTIKLILNQFPRDSGAVRVFGLDNRTDGKKIKGQVGAVFDECYFPGEFKTADVEKMLRCFYQTWDAGLYRSLLSKFRLPGSTPVKDFSRGMRMKLSIAAALTHRPKLLLLDEATSGLDPVVRSEILDLLLEFIQDEEHAVLLSTHITSDLEHVADYVTFLHDGQVVFSESKDDLADSYGILKCGKEDFARVDRALLLRTRQSRFECEALVRNRRAVMRAYPKLVVDRASIEDIMVFYGKGDPQ